MCVRDTLSAVSARFNIHIQMQAELQLHLMWKTTAKFEPMHDDVAMLCVLLDCT